MVMICLFNLADILLQLYWFNNAEPALLATGFTWTCLAHFARARDIEARVTLSFSYWLPSASRQRGRHPLARSVRGARGERGPGPQGLAGAADNLGSGPHCLRLSSAGRPAARDREGHPLPGHDEEGYRPGVREQGCQDRHQDRRARQRLRQVLGKVHSPRCLPSEGLSRPQGRC